MGKDTANFDTCTSPGELFSLTPVQNKRIEVSFTAPDLSSQGGLLLMKEHEHQHGFIARLSNCIEDSRFQPLVQHSYYEMLRQRVCQIAAGYEDADDSDLLRKSFRTFYQCGFLKHYE